ncbi:MAG: DNA polymerase III subunit delta [Clostridia bacterium]|nr:DNA polymerase III subunit delta [Clostridia bacterium]
MAEFDEKGLKAHIKSGNFLSAYLIVGDEDYLKKHYTDLISSKVVDEAFESFNLQKFEGKGLSLRDVFDASELMPMMSDKRCVIVEDFRFDSLNEKDYGMMLDFFSDLPDFTVMIFHQKSADFSLSKAKKAVDLFKKFGAVCTLNKRTGNDLLKPLISSAAKQKCELSVQNAKYLVSVCGDDFNVLINELGKICHYAKQGEITKAHIDAVAVKTDDAKIYALTKALMSKDFDRAYDVLASLFRQKTEPEYILGTIISSYVDIYRARVSLISGKNADSLASDFNYRNTAFRLTNAARDSKSMDLATVRKCLDELSKADKQLKSGRDNAALVLVQLMVKLFLLSNGEKV